MTHPVFRHPDGHECIWDGILWFVPVDAGGEGHACELEHPTDRLRSELAQLTVNHADAVERLDRITGERNWLIHQCVEIAAPMLLTATGTVYSAAHNLRSYVESLEAQLDAILQLVPAEHRDNRPVYDQIDEYVRQLRADREKPNLGCATTLDLINELRARAEVSAIAGERWPSYRTVDHD